jgi:hypothetical protein
LKLFTAIRNTLMKYIFLLLISLILTGYSKTFAETNPEMGNWNIFLLKAKIKNKFSFSGELHFRSEKVNSTFNYCEYKGAILYSFSKHFGFSAGASGIKKGTGEVIFSNNGQTEFMTWVDFLLLQHSFGRLNLEHRGRWEQHFIPSDYQNKLRYRLLLNLPVNHPQMTANTLFLSTYDEIFIGENDPMWERNKFCGAAGYKVNQNLSFQLGDIIMTELKKGSTSGKNYLMLQISYTI